jgi:hypothetical protein
MTSKYHSKWAGVIATLQASPGEWMTVATDATPSTVQRIRSLGAEVTTQISSPRTGERGYDRYTVLARWPDPATELERVQLAHAQLTQEVANAKADMDASEEEYNSAKRILNRNAFRRKQAREKYEPLLEQLDQLTALINRMTTEKD